jgi:FixJ family two-component response regulator
VAPNANASESTLVIVVDDDASVANSTCRLIRSFGMQLQGVFSGADLLKSARATEASCLILDVRMPNLDGLQLKRRFKEIRPSIPIIFFSAHVMVQPVQYRLGQDRSARAQGMLMKSQRGANFQDHWREPLNSNE